MALGFTIGEGETALQVLPDRSFSKSSTPRTSTVKFGDGYEQRLRHGLNPIEEVFQIAFVNRKAEEVEDIEDFFIEQGTTPFDYTIPKGLSERVVKVVCENYNIVYVANVAQSISATFRKVNDL